MLVLIVELEIQLQNCRVFFLNSSAKVRDGYAKIQNDFDCYPIFCTWHLENKRTAYSFLSSFKRSIIPAF